jgi:hypothetical protein
MAAKNPGHEWSPRRKSRPELNGKRRRPPVGVSDNRIFDLRRVDHLAQVSDCYEWTRPGAQLAELEVRHRPSFRWKERDESDASVETQQRAPRQLDVDVGLELREHGEAGAKLKREIRGFVAPRVRKTGAHGCEREGSIRAFDMTPVERLDGEPAGETRFRPGPVRYSGDASGGDRESGGGEA